MKDKDRDEAASLRILLADDSPDAIAQMTSWIHERWPSAELLSAMTPEDAIKTAIDEGIENLILDLDFGTQRSSGVVVARKVLDTRSKGKQLQLRTRILFRTAHAGDPGYLHQVEKLIVEERHRPAVWGFLDKGSIPKRLAQNTVEHVFIYEMSFTEILAKQLKTSPLRELSDLEFTVLIDICLGVTNEGIGWRLGASRQSVERIISGLYRKMRLPLRREAPQGVPTLIESRTRLGYEAIGRGWVNAHLLREEDATLREAVKKSLPAPDRLYVNREWLDPERPDPQDC
jgi:DNA-binding NarL/FixJ family response regulator